MKQIKTLGHIVFWTLILVACSTGSELRLNDSMGQVVPVDGGGQYIDLTPQELDSVIANKDFFFVNVHIPYEGEIPNTDAFIPFDEIISRLSEFPSDKDAKIVVYCRSGSMSAIAARSLVEEGFTNIFNLDGGFRSWEQSGFEFIQ